MPDLSLLFDTAAARALDGRASALAGDGGWSLMAQAGLAGWQCLLQQWPEALQLCVLAGAGNNGGDGYVLASHALRSGRQVQVVTLPGTVPATALAAQAAAEFAAAGGCIVAFDGQLPAAEIYVDALFGLGLDRAPAGMAQSLIEALSAAQRPVLAMDVPSGVDADSGCVPGVAVKATVTLQFIACHRGLYTGDALEQVGQRRLAPLELPDQAWDGIHASAQRWTGDRLPVLLPPRRANTHKGESGHVLCIGGNHGSGGAVVMAAEAALRAGAGLLSVGTRRDHVGPLLARLPEAMAHALEDSDALPALLDRAGVVAIGPGLGQDEWARALFARVLACDKPLVVDADALNLLAAEPSLAERVRRRAGPTVLTPHPLEAARLAGCDVARIQSDRLACARALARHFGATIVLKGSGSVIDDGTHTWINTTGNAGLATGARARGGASAPSAAGSPGSLDAALRTSPAVPWSCP